MKNISKKILHRSSKSAQKAGMHAVTTLERLYGLPDKAGLLQKAVVSELERAGFSVCTEEQVSKLQQRRTGRLDVLAVYRGGTVAIELDARSPRQKSIEKLLQFDAFRIIGLRNISMPPPIGIDAVVALHVGQDYEEEFSRFVAAYPRQMSADEQKAVLSVFMSKLRIGRDANQIILGARRYAQQCTLKDNELAAEIIPAVEWLKEELWG
ncbi:hypothetical protein WJT86_10060 [Microvirga sp. W0021]|uniref:Uncharacterized protein n=1 Tax=Hohaiivirga grylli TaxID=3133970 RepID=A0ABV0BK87_9HYPH